VTISKKILIVGIAIDPAYWQTGTVEGGTFLKKLNIFSLVIDTPTLLPIIPPILSFSTQNTVFTLFTFLPIPIA